jgi:hypothetical protein
LIGAGWGNCKQTMYTLQVATLSPGQTIAAQLPLHSGDFGRSSGEVNADPKQGIYIYMYGIRSLFACFWRMNLSTLLTVGEFR